MNINYVNSSPIYKKIMLAEKSQKIEIYRHEMMKPFMGKWDCYHIPLKSEKPGGYDIIMASDMLGLLPPAIIDQNLKYNCNPNLEATFDTNVETYIEAISDPMLWEYWKKVISDALNRFVSHSISLKVSDYLFSILLANPESPYTIINEGYCGDGGIPGYIMGWLIPNKETLKKLPAVLTHEVNHNVRYQYIKWNNDVTLGEMLVSEGLAENFATSFFGEKYLGPWVTKTDPFLFPLIKEIIYDGLDTTGFDNITSYLYGDEMARMQHFPEVGLPYCAGYATGYYLIKHFLHKTGISVEEATILPACDILKEVDDFWEI